MPMVPEAIVGMLAAARIGAVHSVVFGGFAAHELATRINDARPKFILSASCGIEPGRIIAYKPLLDKAIELATHKPDGVVIVQRPELVADLKAGEHDWAGLVASTRAKGRRAEPVRSQRPIRSTSSTRRGRRASRKAWCATMADTWWR